ncbi:MAG: hypothetical protein KIT62_16510 [Cyclobacteriaceae bacterium]|nr:hypothetical protein [Cyclobacteriaceae bacterium]
MEKFAKNKLVLETHLEELTHILVQSEFIPKVKASLPAFINWDIMDAEQKKIANSIFNKYLNTDRTLYNSLFISAVASFESFLTQTIESTIQILNENFKRFDSYNDVFLNRQIEFSGKMLSSVYSPPHHMNIDFYKLCKNIGTISPGSTTLTLNTEIAGYFRNILELDTFSKFFDDLGIKINLEEISKVQNVQAVFETSGVKETLKRLDDFLKETIRFRNRIAHTGQSSSDITKETIDNLIKKIICIADAINSILTKGLNNLIKK